MKVYGVYSGCIYEGGGVQGPLYLNIEDAIKAAHNLVRRNQAEHKRLFKVEDPEHFKDYSWHKKGGISKSYWDNSVDCVMVQEFEVV